MLNILWLNSDTMGCGVYRCYTPALSLQAQGVADNDFMTRKAVPPKGFDFLNGHDVVVFQRYFDTRAEQIMRACKERGITTVIEMDDDLFHIPLTNPSGHYWGQKKVRKQCRTLLNLADFVITSTGPLADTVCGVMDWDAGRVCVCQNHLHPDIWGKDVWGEVIPHPNVNPTTGEPYRVIGWQGSQTHNEDFKHALPALARIVQERQNVVIRFLGCVPSSVKGALRPDRFQFANGVPFERYPSTLRYMAFDIGIAPIQDTRFNASKSNLKWLEYAALGIPCVASNAGPYAASIEYGAGFLADDTDDWYEALSLLLDDSAVREKTVAAARLIAWERWGVSHADSWTSAFTQAREFSRRAA